MEKTRRKRLTQTEIDSLVQETASKVVPRAAAAATATVTRPAKAAAATPQPPAPIRPEMASLEDSLATVQAAVARLNERLDRTEKALGGFEKQISAVETSLVEERQARDEQAREIGEIRETRETRDAGGDWQVEALRKKLTELTECLEMSEQILNNLAERMAVMEAAAEQFDQYRRAFEAALMANQQLQMAQSQSLGSQMETIAQGLSNTLGYDIKKNFVCDSCGAEGAVALKIRCTQCEKQNWWGWWPKEMG